jgi:hypothetical protein
MSDAGQFLLVYTIVVAAICSGFGFYPIIWHKNRGEHVED